MLNLPEHLLMEIFSWLPATSVLRLRCLNKSWNSVIKSNHFIRLHLVRTVENINETRRWRVLMCVLRRPAWSIKVEGLDKMLPQPDDVLDQSVEQSLLDFDGQHHNWVLGPCNGLFCIIYQHNYVSTFMVWNPCTSARECAPLNRYRVPGVDYSYESRKYNWYVYGFGCDGISTAIDVFKIVRLASRYYSLEESNACQTMVDISILTLGGSSWRKYEEIVPRMVLYGEGLYFEGALHWIDEQQHNKPRGIVVFSLGKEKFEQVMPLPEYEGDTSIKYRLRVMCGKLAFYFCNLRGSFGFEIWLMEQYGVKESWTKKIKITDPVYPYFMEPLSFLRNGSVLLNKDDERTLVYDPKEKTYSSTGSLFQELPLCRYETPGRIEYIETLVSPIHKASDADAPK